MAYLLCGNAIILIVLWIGVSRRASLYSPLMLSALVWQVVFISGLYFGDRFYPLTERAFFMWLTWFLVSSIFYISLPSEPQPTTESELRRLPVDYTIILVGLILWLGYRAWVIGNVGPVQFFLNLRLSSNGLAGFEALGLVGRFYPWVFALFLFEHVNASDDNRRQRRLLWCWMLLHALSTMGKFTILTPFLAWAVIKGIRWVLPMRRLLILAPTLFGIMVVLHFVRAGKGEHIAFADFLSIYTYSPIVALGYFHTPVDAPFGAYTFRFFYALIHGTFGGIAPVPVIQDYVAVPYLTNVYTVMQPFTADFGLVGVLFGSVVYGSVFGLLFHHARTTRQLPLIIYSGLSVVLVGQFIGEQLFTMLSGHLQFIIAAIIFTSASRRTDLVG